MQVKSGSGFGGKSVGSRGTKSGPSLLSESEHSSMTEKVNALQTEADGLRGKIRDLESQYKRDKVTARQHDKLVKQYLLKLFDTNRELLPLKERLQKDVEERERVRVRQKLEAVNALEERIAKASRKRRIRRTSVARANKKRRGAKR